MASKFQKAKPQQAFFKAGFYGGQGRGKTLTGLMVCEGLAKRTGKRTAVIDTERGTDFYAMAIPERRVHPEAFDFDVLYTRSIMETLEAIQSLDTNVYGQLLIDSITHLWEAAKESYTGKRMANGGIPIQAWGSIKKPYKQLMTAFLDGNFHAVMCGREGIIMEDNDDGEPKPVGTKMKAEGETGYEPHILLRFQHHWLDDGTSKVACFGEKDRSGILTGKTIIEPNYGTIEPIVKYLSGEAQGKVGSIEDAAEKDAAAIERGERKADEERSALYEQIRTALVNSGNLTSLKAAWDLTSGKKTKLGPFFEKLETIKDARKAELMEVAA